jgi:hypothetical protein
MDEKEIKNYMKELSDDFGKQVGVYVEHVDNKFKVVNEGITAIHKKLDSQEEMIAGIAEDVTLIKVQVGDHEGRIAELETKI